MQHKQLNRVYPDEDELISEICRRIDGENDPQLAWQQVSNISLTGFNERDEEHDMLRLAVSFNIGNATVAYINLRDNKIATGVLVQIGEHVFLATTSHSIPANPRNKLSFICKESSSISANVPVILDSAKSDLDSTWVDVAFLELDPTFVKNKIGKAGISIDRIYPCGTGHPDRLTIVAGYPSEMVTDQEISNGVLNKLFTMNSWSNKILKQDDWRVLESRNRQPDVCKDLFIPYTRDDEIRVTGPLSGSVPDTLPEPFGMSGGGYWQPNVELKKELFSPDYYSLIAIQSHWWNKGRYLQGTQIIHWLSLLHEKRPDLRNVIETTFPECQF